MEGVLYAQDDGQELEQLLVHLDGRWGQEQGHRPLHSVLQGDALPGGEDPLPDRDGLLDMRIIYAAAWATDALGPCCLNCKLGVQQRGLRLGVQLQGKALKVGVIVRGGHEAGRAPVPFQLVEGVLGLGVQDRRAGREFQEVGVEVAAAAEVVVAQGPQVLPHVRLVVQQRPQPAADDAVDPIHRDLALVQAELFALVQRHQLLAHFLRVGLREGRLAQVPEIPAGLTLSGERQNALSVAALRDVQDPCGLSNEQNLVWQLAVLGVAQEDVGNQAGVQLVVLEDACIVSLQVELILLVPAGAAGVHVSRPTDDEELPVGIGQHPI
mmetsp:Transcript_48680/g.86618  ORF Transcript_48680/g.86618 Transcript_48680/m.86618 type:complete len:325 (+) Transcript_48680:1000-1974(+)